jgi:hypothetical protein
MTSETYENLMRVQLKRQRQASQRGDWDAVHEAQIQIEALNQQMREEG